MECPACGRKNMFLRKICKYCGTKMTELNQIRQSNNTSTENTEKKDEVAFVFDGDIFRNIKGVPTLLIGKSISTLKVGDKLRFNSYKYEIAKIYDKNNNPCNIIEGRKICAIGLREKLSRIEREELMSAVKNCQDPMGKYTLFYLYE